MPSAMSFMRPASWSRSVVWGRRGWVGLGQGFIQGQGARSWLPSWPDTGAEPLVPRLNRIAASSSQTCREWEHSESRIIFKRDLMPKWRNYSPAACLTSSLGGKWGPRLNEAPTFFHTAAPSQGVRCNEQTPYGVGKDLVGGSEMLALFMHPHLGRLCSYASSLQGS